jgi:thiol-disulfide isomerase/thioredoxin
MNASMPRRSKNRNRRIKKKLQKAYEDMTEICNLYDEKCKENEVLIEQQNLRFSNRQKRIEAIVEIAKAERESLLDDIESLIRDNERFSIESLMAYTPREWLNKRNQIAVTFIETLVHNNIDTDSLSQEKIFKTAVAVDAIYGARHEKYVSEIQLAASAIKYSIARSKMIITIDNHITSSGSYYRFQKWLEELSEHEESLPEGLLFLAFDNEQRGQKNYLDRGSNTVIFHIVTSFVAFNMASQNKIQHTNSPWAYHSLNRLQYEELFDINPQMQEALDKELYDFLSEICNLLSEEKLSSTNTIDSFIASVGTNTTSMKKCPNCHHQNIENRKQTCPSCKTRLPTLAEIQKEREAEIENEIIDRSTMPTMPLIFKPYILNNESSVTCTSTSRISHTQRPADQGVIVPKIYVPDSININPNSIANVEKVLLHIENISGIKNGTRKWIAVTCDGVPYHHATKLKEKFP